MECRICIGILNVFVNINCICEHQFIILNVANGDGFELLNVGFFYIIMNLDFIIEFLFAIWNR